MEKNRHRWLIGILVMAALTDAYSQAAFPEITVNLNYPQYQRLKSDGGYAYIEGGMRGIILYRESENSIIAYERACPHHPSESCAEVQVDMSSLFMIDRCCKSSFSFSNGSPTGGPAQRSLFQYHTELNGMILKISDEIIN